MKCIICLLTLSLFSFKLISAPFCEPGNGPWGIDSDLINVKKEKADTQKRHLNPGQKTCRAMIRFFQVYISPIDGPRSSFYPTSSQYAWEAIQKYGVFQGIAMGCDRLMRENGEMWVYETTKNYGIERKLDPVR